MNYFDLNARAKKDQDLGKIPVLGPAIHLQQIVCKTVEVTEVSAALLYTENKCSLSIKRTADRIL